MSSPTDPVPPYFSALIEGFREKDGPKILSNLMTSYQVLFVGQPGRDCLETISEILIQPRDSFDFMMRSFYATQIKLSYISPLRGFSHSSKKPKGRRCCRVVLACNN